jgi:hypothetical protein
MKATAPVRVTLSEARNFTDRELVNAFFKDSGNRSVHEKVLSERMLRYDYSDLFMWVWDTPAYGIGINNSKSKNSKYGPIPHTKDVETMRRELTAFVESGYKFDNVRMPAERAKRFCLPEGMALSTKYRDLTKAQKKLVALLRDRVETYLQGTR